jgi:hypothetical protein
MPKTYNRHKKTLSEISPMHSSGRKKVTKTSFPCSCRSIVAYMLEPSCIEHFLLFSIIFFYASGIANVTN